MIPQYHPPFTRLSPAGQALPAETASVIFRVTYSESVNLSATATDRFAVVAVNGSNIVGSVANVSGTGNTREVTVNITSGIGEFRLRAVD